MKLQGKVAVVTGSATGIGKAIATGMAAEGAAIVVDYVGAPDLANAVVGNIRGKGGKAMAIQADVSNPDQVNAMVEQTIKTMGRLDIFVNNAGMESKHPFTEYPFELWQKVIAVDLTGPFLCAQAAAKAMIQQGSGGRIINISSVHEDLPMPTNAPYCAAKGGLRMLMRTIAVELAPYKITVNNIATGAIYTPIDADVEANKKSDSTLLRKFRWAAGESRKKWRTWPFFWRPTPPDIAPAAPSSSTAECCANPVASSETTFRALAHIAIASAYTLIVERNCGEAPSARWIVGFLCRMSITATTMRSSMAEPWRSGTG